MRRRGYALMAILLLLVGAGFHPFRVEAQESAAEAPTFSEQISDSSQVVTDSEQSRAEASAGIGASSEGAMLPSFSYKDSKESTLGRTLVLSIGLFPFSYFYTGIVIGVTRYVSHGFDSAYAPWSSSSSLSESEMWTKIAISSAASLVFGLLGTILK